MSQRGLLVVGGALLLVFLVIVVSGGAILLASQRPSTVAPTDVPPEPFDREVWREGDVTRRIAMGRHLARTGRLVGRERAELEAMLGPPSGREGDLAQWYLGPRRSGASLMFDYEEHLVVRFDGDGTVAHAFVDSRD